MERKRRQKKRKKKEKKRKLGDGSDLLAGRFIKHGDLALIERGAAQAEQSLLAVREIDLRQIGVETVLLLDYRRSECPFNTCAV